MVMFYVGISALVVTVLVAIAVLELSRSVAADTLREVRHLTDYVHTLVAQAQQQREDFLLLMKTKDKEIYDAAVRNNELLSLVGRSLKEIEFEKLKKATAKVKQK